VKYVVKDGNITVDVTIICDKDSSAPEFKVISPSDETHNIVITATGKEACPLFSLSYFYNKYPIPFAITFIIAGVIIAFLGFRIFNAVLFLMATFVVAFILFNVIYQLAAGSITMENAWVIWLILGAAAIIGIIAGVLAVKFQKYCFFLAGACLGGLIAFMIYTAFLTSTQRAVLCCY
jgi:hypothetical protein